MTPRRAFTLFSLFLLVLLTVIVAACSLTTASRADLGVPSPTPGARALSTPTLPAVVERGGEGPTAEPVESDPIVEVLIIYASGYTEKFEPSGDLVTPTPTEPPAPSHTPAPTATVIPTNTPRPTVTPLLTPIATFIPTWTPTATSTPLPASPTPTAEIITPEPTPLTPEPTTIPPDESVCMAQVVSDTGLNVRSNRSTNGQKYGVLSKGTWVRIYQIQVIYPEGHPLRTEWATIEYGWRTAYIALWNGTELARHEDKPACWEIVDYATEPVVMCPAWHSFPVGVDKTDMNLSFALWTQKGECVGAKGVEELHAPRLALSYGGYGVARFKGLPEDSGDCTNMNWDPVAAANDSWQRLGLNRGLYEAPPSEGWWIELDNECPKYWTNLAWLDTYLSTEIELASAYYGNHVIFGTMLAGDWSRERVQGLPKTWNKALETGTCLGIHAGGPEVYDPVTRVMYRSIDGLNISWLWPYSFQYRDIQRWLAELDPRYARIPMCATEYTNGGAWTAYQPSEYHEWFDEVQPDGIFLFSAVYTSGIWNKPENSVNGKMALTAKLW